MNHPLRLDPVVNYRSSTTWISSVNKRCLVALLRLQLTAAIPHVGFSRHKYFSYATIKLTCTVQRSCLYQSRHSSTVAAALRAAI